MRHSLYRPIFASIILMSLGQTALAEQKKVYLTFDADMTPKMEKALRSGKVKSWYNKEVIDELEKENVPATLFLTGLWIENYKDITKKLSENPLFEIGNHSYSHGSFSGKCYGLPIIKSTEEKNEIEKTDELLKANTANYQKIFRFPGLCENLDSEKKVEDTGYKIINGDVYGEDGFRKNPKVIVHNVLSKVKNGSVIILHMHGGPIAPATAPALHEIIHELKKENFTFEKI